MISCSPVISFVAKEGIERLIEFDYGEAEPVMVQYFYGVHLVGQAVFSANEGSDRRR